MKNICHIFKGYLKEDTIKEVLEYIDNEKIVNKNPDGLFHLYFNITL